MTTRMTQTLFPALLGIAACLLVLSLAVHLAALAALQPPGGNVLFFGLHFGLFLLALALIHVDKMLPRTTDVRMDHWWLPVFPGCPAWINYVARGFYIYALVNFVAFFLINLLSTGTVTLSMSHSSGADDPSIASWRGFSIIWMSIYSAELVIRQNWPSSRPPGGPANARTVTAWPPALVLPVERRSTKKQTGKISAQRTILHSKMMQANLDPDQCADRPSSHT